MSLFLKKAKYKNGKIFLSIVDGFYDSKTKNTKQTVIKKLGYLDELKKQYDDPISYFRAFAKTYSSQNITEYTLKNIDSKKVDINEKNKNLGYMFLRKIYNNLNLNYLLNKKNYLKLITVLMKYLSF